MRKLSNEELNRKNIGEYRKAQKSNVIIVLDNIRSLNNIGSAFRSADAFLVEAIYLCGITGTPPNKDIHKSALGATESVPWKYFENTLDAINELRAQSYEIIALEQVEESIMLDQFIADKNASYAFVFGNEVKGVDQAVVDVCDRCIEIPQFGTKHSFNIAVSVGIVLWHNHISRK